VCDNTNVFICSVAVSMSRIAPWEPSIVLGFLSGTQQSQTELN
jgi:hypothetical protein